MKLKNKNGAKLKNKNDLRKRQLKPNTEPEETEIATNNYTQ
jgi:hypothetical protein